MEGRKVGRPTDYNDQVLASSQEYLKNYTDYGDVIPSVAGLAVYLKTSRQNIYNWAKDNPEFFDILQDILSEQEKTLLSNGLSGKFNSTITKLVLAKHDYTDRQDVTSGGEKVSVNIINYSNDDDNDSAPVQA